ncbi:hypothetical protein [Shewanella sp. UCD-KL21]|uniref:hypothetical protein n=1 Tax=Shewanella sp. UCD-KL21 TaxID=1917164 RepID=UPI00097073F6|nr:hypothetical protein [Shewanella sp. UCD-KL21]
MQNPLSSKVKQIDGKLHAEFPAKVTDTLNIKEGDIIEFGLSKHIELWKSQQITIPEKIVPLSKAAFKSDDYIFRWLNTSRRLRYGCGDLLSHSLFRQVYFPISKPLFDVITKLLTPQTGENTYFSSERYQVFTSEQSIKFNAIQSFENAGIPLHGQVFGAFLYDLKSCDINTILTELKCLKKIL